MCHPACSTHGQTAPDAEASEKPLQKKKKEREKEKKRKEKNNSSRILPLRESNKESPGSWAWRAPNLHSRYIMIKAAIGAITLLVKKENPLEESLP